MFRKALPFYFLGNGNFISLNIFLSEKFPANHQKSFPAVASHHLFVDSINIKISSLTNQDEKLQRKMLLSLKKSPKRKSNNLWRISQSSRFSESSQSRR